MRARVHEGTEREIAQGFHGARLCDYSSPSPSPSSPFRGSPLSRSSGPRFGFSGKARRQVPAFLCAPVRLCATNERHMVILYTPFWNRVFSMHSPSNVYVTVGSEGGVPPLLHLAFFIPARLPRGSQKRHNFVHLESLEHLTNSLLHARESAIASLFYLLPSFSTLSILDN